MGNHICPWWMGYVLANPLRRLLENPDKILGGFVQEGMTAVDYGCGMGFFTLPLAKMVGPAGKVIAVDVQRKMLDGMLKRARRAGLSDRIESVQVNGSGPIIKEPVDFVAALNVVHELPDAESFFSEMSNIIKPEGKLLIMEPGFHVKENDFQESLDLAASAGFKITDEKVPGGRRTALLKLASS